MYSHQRPDRPLPSPQAARRLWAKLTATKPHSISTRPARSLASPTLHSHIETRTPQKPHAYGGSRHASSHTFSGGADRQNCSKGGPIPQPWKPLASARLKGYQHTQYGAQEKGQKPRIKLQKERTRARARELIGYLPENGRSWGKMGGPSEGVGAPYRQAHESKRKAQGQMPYVRQY
jgi:hypothetical protein